MLNNIIVTNQQLSRIDSLPMSAAAGQVMCFTGIKNEILRLPYFLEYHRHLGVDRFFIMDNGSTDGTREFVLEQPDCHCFHTEGSHFALNVDPPNWTNALLNVFGVGNWCVAMDADELLVYPDCEQVDLRRFCRFLETSSIDALIAHMIDMYGPGPVANAPYRRGQPFLEVANFFDSHPGKVKRTNGTYPVERMFGGVRERAFWKGKFRREYPPCLTKVPLIRWRHGMRYLVAQHLVNEVTFSDIQGALLHFKFLTEFQGKTAASIRENDAVLEKGLQERVAYLAALERDPNLTLMDKNSVSYASSRQLVELGWMRTSPAYQEVSSSRGVS